MIISISGKMNAGKDTVAKEIMRHSSYPFVVRKWADALKDAVCMWLGVSREVLEDREFKERPLGPQWQMWSVVNKSKHPDDEDYIVSEYILQSDCIQECNRLNQGRWRGKPGAFIAQPSRMTPRKMLQLLGTEYGRKLIHPNMWVNVLLDEYNPKKDFWIITDTRFPNEASAVKRVNGVNIRVNRLWIPEVGEQVFSIHSSGIHSVVEVIDSETVHTTWDKENPNGQRIADLRKPSDEHESETALDDHTDNWDYIIDNDAGLEHLRSRARSVYEDACLTHFAERLNRL